MEKDCIFCRIVAGEIPADILERSGEAIVLRDLRPQAPTHVLVIPVRHCANLGEFAQQVKPEALGNLLATASRVGRDAGPEGYRVVVNEGRNGGQTVDHLHLHVLAGRPMHWPPG